ncbi:MAG: hypothetical protein AAGF57_12185 [Pseudomonadota bacterium]
MITRVMSVIAIMLFTARVVATEIDSAEQADAFLDQYCVALVNEIAKAVKRQESYSAKDEWQKVGEQGAYIAGVADVYSKLCTRR